ncbi:MAG: FkbM family methyltransferase [Bacteroidetes bacterium]|nr:FkbM family methyltransferase [Bacteroidota bacterium]
MRKGSEVFNELENIDFIKCDVEGFELVILDDIKLLIQKFKPSMLIETSEESRQNVLEFMHALGYQSYVILKNKLVNYSEGNLPTPDILFLPIGNKK